MPEINFKFNIGDLVILKVGIEQSRLSALAGEAAMPMSFMICERQSQECPGGVQLHYVISEAGKLSRVLEQELVLSSTIDKWEHFELYVDCSEKLRRAKRAAEKKEMLDDGGEKA